jgi:hypothetical protein
MLHGYAVVCRIRLTACADKGRWLRDKRRAKVREIPEYKGGER